MDIEIINARNSKPYGSCNISPELNVGEFRKIIHKEMNAPKPERQLLRLQSSGKVLTDNITFDSLNIKKDEKICLKDLGPQIAWKTVFLVEYTGPLIIYLIYYINFIYLYPKRARKTIPSAVHLAALCNSVHYIKRLLETVYVHRFSHATMAVRNLLKNCAYYWGFTAYIAWHINHRHYICPSVSQMWTAATIFVLSEFGNFFVHMALRNLRPPGTKERRIPMPDGNIFTKLFKLVSCPNYTYEICAWIAFAVMTSCLPALLFAFVGAYQMAIWALIKHRNYKKEFKNYPKNRRAIFPLIL